MDFSNIYTQLGILFMIMLMGYILGKRKFIKSEHTVFLSKFVVRVAIPMLLISSMIIPLTQGKLHNAIKILLLSIPCYGIAYIIGIICSRILTKEKTEQKYIYLQAHFPMQALWDFQYFKLFMERKHCFMP